MEPTLFLIFNHRFSIQQETAARKQLRIERIIPLRAALQKLWSQIPPDLLELRPYLLPLQDWLAAQARPGDYVLIQGDFGASYLMVDFAFAQRLIPVYATTCRQAVEEHQPDGTVKMTHHFQHQIFRKYGV